jgi:hypothetical protein
VLLLQLLAFFVDTQTSKAVDNLARLRERTDHASWKQCDVVKLHQAAKHWRNAETNEEQAKIFNEFGVHWSEFWLLLY